MIGSLAAKEWKQHRRVIAGAAFLVLAQLSLLLSFVLSQEDPSLLRAATAFAWGGGPILAAFAARRLFVIEHEQGTIVLLRSLPISPYQLTAAKMLVALAVNLLFCLGALGLVALVSHRQELIPIGWLLRLCVQISSYVFAWVAIASLMAHLGVYRHALWLVLFLLLTGLDDVIYEPNRYLFWTAPLADSLELTRYAAPWDGVLIALLWGLAATVLTFGLAGFRGGAWVDALYAPMSGRRRAQVTGAIFALMLVYEIGSDLAKQAPKGAGGLPRVGYVAYAHRDLEALAGRANTELEIIAELVQADLPHVTLAWRHDRRPEAALTESVGDSLLIGLAPGGDQDDLLREIITDVLAGHTGFHLERHPPTGVWAIGFAAFWLEQRGAANIDAVKRRAAFVARRYAEAPVDAYDRVRAEVGRGGAEALGWAAWHAVAEAGSDPLDRLAEALFGPARTQSSAGLLGTRGLNPLELLQDQGLHLRGLTHRIRARLQAQLPKHPTFPIMGPPTYVEDMERLGALHWSLPPGLSPKRVQLWWSTAEPLSRLPLPHTPLRAARIHTSSGSMALPADPRERLVAAWVLDSVVQGWMELPRQ